MIVYVLYYLLNPDSNKDPHMFYDMQHFVFKDKEKAIEMAYEAYESFYDKNKCITKKEFYKQMMLENESYVYVEFKDVNGYVSDDVLIGIKKEEVHF